MAASIRKMREEDVPAGIGHRTSVVLAALDPRDVRGGAQAGSELAGGRRDRSAGRWPASSSGAAIRTPGISWTWRSLRGPVGGAWRTACSARFVRAADEAGRPVFLEVRPRNAEALGLYREMGLLLSRHPQALLLRHRRGRSGDDAPGRRSAKPLRGGRPRGQDLSLPSSPPVTTRPPRCCLRRGEVLSNVVHSQDAIHERYGGVVPEVASRAHVERMTRGGPRGSGPGRRRHGRSGRRWR